MKRLALVTISLLISAPAMGQTVGTYMDATTGVTQRAQGVTLVNSDGTAGTAGNIASGATDSGNPVKIGGVFNTTPPTFTNGQRGDIQVNSRGILKIQLTDSNSNTGALFLADQSDALATSATVQHLSTAAKNYTFNGTTWDRQRGDTNGTVTQPALSATFWNYAAAAGGITNTTTAVTVKAAAGASVRNYVAAMQCSSDALGAATELAIRDGAAGTVIWRGKINTGGWLTPVNLSFNPPLRGTANTLVEIVTLTASVTGSVYCDLQGYTGS